MNVIAAPVENIELYKDIILKRGFGKPTIFVDEIIEEDDDARVQNGWPSVKEGYAETEKTEDQLITDAETITDQKTELDKKLIAISDELASLRVKKLPDTKI